MSDISNRPTDLSLSKGFSKNITVEDLQKFQEISAYCGIHLMILEYYDIYKIWDTIKK